jgi:hypothetical protein
MEILTENNQGEKSSHDNVHCWWDKQNSGLHDTTALLSIDTVQKLCELQASYFLSPILSGTYTIQKTT